MSETFQNAVIKAINWLKANRDKHIAGDLAIDTRGRACTPNDPNAECFCMLGRISYELGETGYPDNSPNWPRHVDDDDIYRLNDRVGINGPKVCHGLPQGNESVFDLTRRLLVDNDA